jgi:hypothetical protein
VSFDSTHPHRSIAYNAHRGEEEEAMELKVQLLANSSSTAKLCTIQSACTKHSSAL